MRKTLGSTRRVALAPDVIFASGSAAVGPLRRATRTVPIVFAATPDPVGAGFVESLVRPGGNTTGFTPYEYGIGAKWLEVLKQIAPSVTRVAVVRDPTITAGIGLWGAIQSVSPSFGVELRPVDVSDAGEIERALAAFAGSPNGGLIMTGSALAVVHRDLIIALGLASPESIVLLPATSVASSGAKSRPTCRCRVRPNTIW
jgi:putative ABC transport system substrate-binding protein